MNPIIDAIFVSDVYTLPDGVKVAEIPGTHAEFMNAPVAIEGNGVAYGKASHNSDTFKIIYRSDRVFMKVRTA